MTNRAHMPAGNALEVRVECPKCQRELRCDDLTADTLLRCECGQIVPIAGDAIDGTMLRRCPLCGTDDVYLQKDFPERIGILLVTAGVVLATIAWYYYSWIGTFGTLFLFFAVDWILFQTRPNVTVCYRCLAQFRGMAENPTHRAFDLAVGERYRQERLRKRGREP